MTSFPRFFVPKKNGPVINLKDLNAFVTTRHFKMEGIQKPPTGGDWL
jgi:hypothetical protein